MERYNTAYRAGTAAQSAEFDAGLRSYMLKVYNYMASGVLLTGIVALLLAKTPSALAMFYQIAEVGAGQYRIVGITGLGIIAALSPLAFILVLSFGSHKMSASTLQAVFWAFAGVFGISLTTVLFQFTGESVLRTFFVSAAAFGGLSLYGYTTKRSLSGLRTFLVMGVIGLLIAGIVNMFLQSPMLHFIYSAAGVLIFSALTAYDTQRIKETYYMTTTGETVAKGAILGAVTLYLDFVNLFLFLLQFLGNRE